MECFISYLYNIVGIIRILYINCSNNIRVKNYYKQKEFERKGIKKLSFII